MRETSAVAARFKLFLCLLNSRKCKCFIAARYLIDWISELWWDTTMEAHQENQREKRAMLNIYPYNDRVTVLVIYYMIKF